MVEYSEVVGGHLWKSKSVPVSAFPEDGVGWGGESGVGNERDEVQRDAGVVMMCMRVMNSDRPKIADKRPLLCFCVCALNMDQPVLVLTATTIVTHKCSIFIQQIQSMTRHLR